MSFVVVFVLSCCFFNAIVTERFYEGELSAMEMVVLARPLYSSFFYLFDPFFFLL